MRAAAFDFSEMTSFLIGESFCALNFVLANNNSDLMEAGFRSGSATSTPLTTRTPSSSSGRFAVSSKTASQPKRPPTSSACETIEETFR